jgi:ribonuclease J
MKKTELESKKNIKEEKTTKIISEKINIVDEEKESSVKIFALGGLEEVGKNTYIVEQENEVIIIDVGVKFANNIAFGIDAILPDYTYLTQKHLKVKAILITHGHEDHIGGIPYLLKQVKVPFIYSPYLASGLIREKLKSHQIDDLPKIVVVDNTNVIKLKNFTISFFNVNHSIPDALGIKLTTKHGTIISTGDYKFDWTPLGNKSDLIKMAEIGKENVSLLLSDSTNSEIEGQTMSEKKVIKRIGELFSKAKGRILISTFASNVHRIQQIIEVANIYKRKILIFGRSLERIITIIRQLGHLKILDKCFIKANESKKYKNNQLVIICTGSQGEPMAALSRIAKKEHKHIKIIEGDTVIFSSSAIPGNKINLERVINNLTRLGAIVLENSPLNSLHTSGHAAQEEQKLMLTLINPRYFMPMHGDYRMLKAHAKTAIQVGILKENIFVCSNGEPIILKKGICTLSKEKINTGPIYLSGVNGKPITKNIINEREILSSNGLIAIIITVDAKRRKLLAGPFFVSRGLFYVKEEQEIVSNAIRFLRREIEKILEIKKANFNSIKNNIKMKLSTYIFQKKRRNPLIIPLILNKQES